jgi:glycine/D-amino acid oxidase-like deaminating enzyme
MSPPVDPVKSDEKLPESADVVIIGGGIVGSSAAYFLAKKGHRTALVEKGRIGGEQSSRNWGWCRQQGRDRREIPLVKESLALWGGLEREIGTDVGFRRTGVLYVSTNPADIADWERWLGHARDYQIETRLLTAAEAAAQTPGCSEKWLGGLYTPSDGRAEPAKAAPAIAEAARRLGASLHQECAARGIETAAGAVSTLVTEKGPIKTRAVLCAGGAWTSLFCRRHAIDLPQLSVRASVLRTTPAPAVTEGAIGSAQFCIRRRLDGGYSLALRNRVTADLTPDYFRYLKSFWPAFRRDRRNLKLRVGQRFWDGLRTPRAWALDRESPFEKVRVLDPEPDHGVLGEALANLRRAYASLKDVRMAESWAGMIDVTPDEVPVISPVEALPGFWIATGFSGHGFGIGPAAGRLAADLVAGDPTIVDPEPFRYSRMIDGSRLSAEVGL